MEKEEKKTSLYKILHLSLRGYKLFSRKCPKLIFSTVIFAIVNAVTPYIAIFLTAQIINEIAGTRDLSILYHLVLFSLLCTTVLASLNALLSRWKNYESAGQWYIRDSIYTEKMLSMDYCDVDDPKIHKMIAEIKQNEDWFGWGLGILLTSSESFVKSIATIIGSITLSISLFTNKVPSQAGWLVILNHPLFILLIVCIMLGVTILVPVLTNKANSYWANFADDVKMCTHFETYFRNHALDFPLALDIRTYRQNELSNKYFKESEQLADHSKKTLAPMRLFHSAATGVSYIFTTIIYIFVCLKALSKAFGVGSVTQYIASITAISTGVSGILQFLGDLRNNYPFLVKVFYFLDTPNNMRKGNKVIEINPTKKYEIEFRNVSFKYPSTEEYALQHISLKFVSGERLALVGQNGSGKTTFIKLLCRLYDPTEGSILLNGIDIREIDSKLYRDILSVVFQDFKLFSYSLGQNVATCCEYKKDKTMKCLLDAGLEERMKSLPNGLNTYLYKDFKKNGVTVSGGEAQKIALARGLYKDSAFIILDEPTAALDPISECEIYNRMNSIVGEKTALFISHRLSSCRFCNDIVVFHKGRITQRGSHQTLVKDKLGKYFELWQAQAKYYQ